MNRFMLWMPTILLIAILTACQHPQKSAPPAQPAPQALQAGAPANPVASAAMTAIAIVRPSAAATTRPDNNDVTGTVTFTAVDGGIQVFADISGLAPNTRHGFHIHAKSDLSAPDLSSAGPHFNPTKDIHGGPDSPHHHAGDLGNLSADADGHATLTLVLKNLKIADIVGRSVIIHAHPDDMTSNPAGNSGARIAGGVIEAQ